MNLSEFAPAKVNLFLHVGRPRSDGRHPICSLVTFADIGDELSAEPAGAFELTVTGPFADEAGSADDNLVTRALQACGAPRLRINLKKSLPVAAGLGGGSSDAGAALRLVGRVRPEIGSDRLELAARAVGADGLMCLYSRTCIAEGVGELLSPAPALPTLSAILVNPGVPSPTGAVYQAYDRGGGRFLADRPDLPTAFASPEDLADFLMRQRNDLETSALGREPVIATALDAVSNQAGVLLTRMSGSGATVFGLFVDDEKAEAAANDLASRHPKWWVRACHLGAPPPQGGIAAGQRR